MGLSGRVRVIAYNPDRVSADDVPDSVHDVVKPEWKGKVGFAPTNASFQAFVTGMRVLEGDDAARKWLEDLKANGSKTYTNNLATLGFAGGVSERGVYTLTIPVANNTAFTATATPTPGGGFNGVNQTQDAECASFTINAQGIRTAAPNPNNRCW